MFWVVQNNIYRERGHASLMDTLRDKEIPHLEVKVVPFYDLLLPSQFDSHEFKGSINEMEEIKVNSNEPIITMGGLSLIRIGEKKGWKPGSFLNNNFHYENWKKAFGEYLLNAEAIVDSFRHIHPTWDTFFIRPCEDTKDFAGTVYSKEKFLSWRNETVKEDSCFFADSSVVASPVKEILAEYRFFVVDGEIVTYSQYKLGDHLFKNVDIEESVIQFAKKMIDLWQPSRAFVIDVASTPEGYKVIEINNFNSAGFYASDVSKIVDAVEKMKF